MPRRLCPVTRFTAATPHHRVVTLFGWAQDQPGNGSGGVRYALALGVIEAVNRRDG